MCLIIMDHINLLVNGVIASSIIAILPYCSYQSHIPTCLYISVACLEGGLSEAVTWKLYFEVDPPALMGKQAGLLDNSPQPHCDRSTIHCGTGRGGRQQFLITRYRTRLLGETRALRPLGRSF